MIPAAVLGCIAFSLVALDAFKLRRKPVPVLTVVAIIAASLCFTLKLEFNVLAGGQQAPTYAARLGRATGQLEYLPATHGAHWQAYNEDGGLIQECARLDMVCTVMPREGQSSIFRIEGTAHRVRLPLFAFPAWRATLDGQPLKTSRDPDTGLVAVDVPSGTHVVRITWAALREEVAGRWLSAIAALVLLLSGAHRFTTKHRRP